MSFWGSMRSAVDRVTGSSASVTLGMDAQFVVPGQTVSVLVDIKNGLGALDVRAVVFEVESVEIIELPRNADWTNVLADALAASAGTPHPARSPAEVARHGETIFASRVTVAPALTLAPGDTKSFKGTFRLPAGVSPSYEGKYAKHRWRARARLDVLGVDPGTGWIPFRVGLPG